MATRPIYLPTIQGDALVEEKPIEFKWHAGLSKAQKQKSIKSLHSTASALLPFEQILEISSKSENKYGRCLSAFSLKFSLSNGHDCTIECAFQGSKVFVDGGPFIDLYGMDSRAAKKDERLKNNGALIKFKLEGSEWPLLPQTCFYDWIYINALNSNKELSDAVILYGAFSDIEFNPQKSINCQAQSAARFVALRKRDLLNRALADKEYFISLYPQHARSQLQGDFFK
jgi:hypothetical protein